MPSNFLAIDTGVPDLGGGGSVEDKLRATQNYLYMLLENLRYVLRNLSPENFNETETLDWIGKNIKAETIISNTVITNELYSDYGAIADLTVDRLRTDWERARRYLAGNITPINYIYIHDEVIDFITGTTDGLSETQLTEAGRSFYWTDETHTRMTCEKVTPYPVMVYVYDELVKASIRFVNTVYDGVPTKAPMIVLGAGYGEQDADRGKGFIRRGQEKFDICLKNREGSELGLFIGGDYTDLVGLRKTKEIDFSGWDDGYFTETADGDIRNGFLVDFDEDDRPVRITDASGHETAVIWQ